MSTLRSPFRPGRRARTPLVGLAVIVLLAAACGGGGSSLEAGTSGSTGGGSGAATSAPGATGSGASGASGASSEYQQCLADHGVTGGVGGAGARRDVASGATGGSGAPGRAGRGSGASGFTGVPGTNADGTPRATIDPATLQAARDACQSLAPADGTAFPGGTGAGGQQFSAYLSCLTDNGVTVPGRDGATGATGAPGGPGGRGFGLGGIDRTSAAFVAADAKCKVLLPDGVDPFAGSGRPGPPAGSVPTTTAAAQ